jgi:hypothetical protein
VRKGATRIEIEELAPGRPIVEELARMLSGSAAAVALDHAESLLGEVRERQNTRS